MKKEEPNKLAPLFASPKTSLFFLFPRGIEKNPQNQRDLDARVYPFPERRPLLRKDIFRKSQAPRKKERGKHQTKKNYETL